MSYKIALFLFSAIFATALAGDINKADLKAATKKLVGVNCIADAIYNLEDAAFECTYQLREVCGGQVANSLELVLEDTDNLTEATGRVIDANDNECNNAAYDEQKDAKKIPTTECVRSITTEMIKLGESVNTLEYDIADALDTVTSACAKTALTNLQSSLQDIPEIISTCGSLTA